MGSRRVVVTGLGVVSCLGVDVNTFWNNLLAGKSGISRITRFDPSTLPVQIAGEVKDFDPSKKFDAKTLRRYDRFTQFAMWAALDAVNDAGLDFSKEDKNRIGVIIGSGMGGIETWERQHEIFLTKGPDRVSPLLIPMMIPDIASGNISIYFGLRGPNYCTTSACASGAHAIGNSFRHIKQGDADIMIAGGSETPITAYCIAGFANMGALSKRNDAPEKASRPFSKDRDGFVIAEGAGVVILEELEHALKRNAKIYCEISGYGITGDAYHITAPAPEGAGAYEAMRLAILEANLTPDDIDYINAHGTSTDLNDLTETQAIKKLFGERAKKIPVNSTKSMIGHALGAAGAIEFVVLCLSIKYQKVHPTINLENADPELDLDYVPEGTRSIDIRAAISNSLGFGAHNTALLAKRFNY
ncbi:MAG: beta-ketoacyl-ACP synthase II [candidate division WOR-3 bacterium]|nr:beta-ketoacyl-ACP synthase II [candidate division WOR-3 bacterium]MDW7987807.1 beta-ketoacyl-ACP synthase II [candidate division WOR-3 bacterium]